MTTALQVTVIAIAPEDTGLSGPGTALCTVLRHSLKQTLFPRKTRQGAGSEHPSKAGEQAQQSPIAEMT